MDGVVVGEPKTVGTMAVQGNSNPTVIMRIADTANKQILAQVDETDIARSNGQEVPYGRRLYGPHLYGQSHKNLPDRHQQHLGYEQLHVVLFVEFIQFFSQRHLLLRHPRRQ